MVLKLIGVSEPAWLLISEPISLITPITTAFALPEGAPALALIQMVKAPTTLNATRSPCLITEKQVKYLHRGLAAGRTAMKIFHLLVEHRDELIIK